MSDLITASIASLQRKLDRQTKAVADTQAIINELKAVTEKLATKK